MRLDMFILLWWCTSSYQIALLQIATSEPSKVELRLRTEAPSAWQSYVDRLLQANAGEITTQINEEDGKPSYKEKAYFKRRSDGSFLLMDHSLLSAGKPTSVQFLRVVNLQYSFKLYRSDPRRGWTVVEKDLDLHDGLTFDDPRTTAVLYAKSCVSLAGCFGLLDDTADAPMYRWGRVTTEDGTNSLIKLEFTHESEDSRKAPLRRGWLVFDANRHWVVRRGHAEFEVGDMTAAKTLAIEYYDGKDGLSLPARLTVQHHNLTTGQRNRFVQEFTYYFDGDPPEEEFYLSYYGLPEPWELQQKASPPTRWFLWLTLVGVALLVLGAFFYYRVRRRAA